MYMTATAEQREGGVVRGGGGARDVLGGTKCGGPEAGWSLVRST